LNVGAATPHAAERRTAGEQTGSGHVTGENKGSTQLLGADCHHGAARATAALGGLQRGEPVVSGRLT
jgi:hypothetical protein